jgi:hypothetical protein
VDRWDLYERSVQDAERTVDLLRALHGGEPRTLGEDFCGSAALSRAWVRRVEGGSAFAVDLDPDALARAGRHPRLDARALDVRALSGLELARLAPCDVVHAGNFSLGELHARAELCTWARSARARLAPGGIATADCYGGESAWRRGGLERRRALDDGRELRWTWEQRSADPLRGEVVNALSFRVLEAGEVVLDLPDAFVYRWRLWSAPELRDAFLEAGFREVEAHVDLAPARSAPAAMRDGQGLQGGFVALLAARF